MPKKYNYTEKTGRPTEYGGKIIKKAKKYRDKLPKDEAVHSIEGLAVALGITRETIYDWESQEIKKEFSDIVKEIRQLQGKALITKGLRGVFNSKITSALLSKHGYREGIEMTGKDGRSLFTPSEDEKKLADEALKSLNES